MKKILFAFLMLTLIIELNSQSFTIGVMLDIQELAENDSGPNYIRYITDWYVGHIDSLNLKFVASLGDMTQWGATGQYQRVRYGFDAFKDISFPYAPCQGNHDSDLTVFNQYFPESEFLERNMMYAGNFKGMQNAFYLFSEGGTDYILLVIQTHDPYIGYYDKASIMWANKIIKKHKNRKVIFITHDFYHNRQLIDDVIKKHDNMFLALCGHDCDRESYWQEKSPSGNNIHCILTDYQCDKDGGMTIRYYTFKPEEKKVYAYTYNVLTGKYEKDENSEFSFGW